MSISCSAELRFSGVSVYWSCTNCSSPATWIVVLLCLIGGNPEPLRAAESGVEESGLEVDGVIPVSSGTAHDSIFSVDFSGGAGLAVGDHGLVLFTKDSGRTWAAQENMGTDLALLGVSLAANRFVAVGQSGIAVMGEVGGESRQGSTGTDSRLLDVSLNNDGTAVAVGAFGTILVSEDNGSTWHSRAPDWMEVIPDGYEPHLYNIEFSPSGSILVAGEFGVVLESDDQGASWQTRHLREESLFSMMLLESGSGLAVGQKGLVIKTMNYGKHWQQLSTGTDANLLDVWVSESGVAVAVGVREMIVSHDHGDTWASVEDAQIKRNWFASIAAADVDIESAQGGHRRPVYVSGYDGVIAEISWRPRGLAPE